MFLVTLDDFHVQKDVLYSNLLQQLVRVKAFLLLIDLDMQLVRDTFEQFLRLPMFVCTIYTHLMLTDDLAMTYQARM